MSNTPVEMKTISALELKHSNVFEMFGNLYQVDAIIGYNTTMEVVAHIIAQVGAKRLKNGIVYIKLSTDTPISIEA